MRYSLTRNLVMALVGAASLSLLGSVAAQADLGPYKVQPVIARTRLAKGDQPPHSCWSNLEQRDGKLQVVLQTATSPDWDTLAGISLVLPQSISKENLDKYGPIEVTFQGPKEIPMYGDALKDHPHDRFNYAGFHVRAKIVPAGEGKIDTALTVRESGQPEEHSLFKDNGDGTYTLKIGGDVLRSIARYANGISGFSFYMDGKRPGGQPPPTHGWQPIRSYIKSVKVCGKEVDFLTNMKEDKNLLVFPL